MTTALSNWNRTTAHHAVVDRVTVNGVEVTYRHLFASNGASAYEITTGAHSANYGSKAHADRAWHQITGR